VPHRQPHRPEGGRTAKSSVNDDTRDSPRHSLARRASTDPFFLGHALAGFAARHGLDDAALAAVLGCPAVLPSLYVCRRPGAAQPDRSAEQDIADICRRFGIDAGALRTTLAR
jgi:hypothetical protein